MTHVVYGAQAGAAAHAVFDDCAQSRFEYKGRIFDSAQAAYEADMVTPLHRPKFSSTGKFGKLSEDTVREVYGGNDDAVQKKLKFLGPRSTRLSMPGALAKKAACFVTSRRRKASTNPGELLARWGPILRNKFNQNPDAKKALLATGEKILVKFDFRGSASLDGGRLERDAVVGGNICGRILMMMRREFRTAPPARSQEEGTAPPGGQQATQTSKHDLGQHMPSSQEDAGEETQGDSQASADSPPEREPPSLPSFEPAQSAPIRYG